MELPVIWYIAAIVTNTAVIVLAVYIALLATAYYIERRIALRSRPRTYTLRKLNPGEERKWHDQF